jgi:hypothetical protein
MAHYSKPRKEHADDQTKGREEREALSHGVFTY